MIEVFGVITTVIAVAGVILNNRKCRWCFVLWAASNTISGLIHYHAGLESLVVRDLIFLVLAVEGFHRWR